MSESLSELRRHADSEAATMFEPGRNCSAVARASRLALLVDAADYFEAFRRAALRAEREILILAWDFDSRTRLALDAGAEPPTAVGDFLNLLAARQPRLHVYVLDWDYPMIYAHDREFPPLFGLGWKPHERVHLQYDSAHPLAGSQHQKIVLIDRRVAFLGGLDLTTKRWDTADHRPGDPRRVQEGRAYPPFHDVMAAVEGDVVDVLARIAVRRWSDASGESLPGFDARGERWPEGLEPDMEDVDVAVACTAPAAEDGGEVREVEQLYVDMIARARRCIYIENQYFTARSVGQALAACLAEPDGPEIVVVTRLLSHGWLEESTMHVLRTRLIRELRAADRRGRFEIYYPHREGLARGTCIDIHSKVMIVDDEWLRVGSANISNRSMGLDSECDIVVEARGEARVASAIRRFRERLLGEHLGVALEEVSAATDRRGAIHAAIRTLQSRERTLRKLDELPEYSEAVIDGVSLADPEQPVTLEAMVERFAPGAEPRRAVLTWKRVLLGAAAFLGLTLAWRYTPLAASFNPAAVTAWVNEFAGRWWAAPLVLLLYTPASLVMFPRPLITMGAVVAFGPWLGFLLAMSGILLAAASTYALGRALRPETVRRLAGDSLHGLSHAFRKRGLLAVTAVRLVPLAPFSLENLVAGAIRLRLSDFLLGTFLGMLPGELAATVFGVQLDAALREPSGINYWVVGGVLALLVAGALGVRRWLRKVQQSVSPRPPAQSSRSPSLANDKGG